MCTKLKFCGGRAIPCGKCDECLKRRRYCEYNRIKCEFEQSENVYHITLTYADLYDFDGFKDIRSFIKGLRKFVPDLSFFAVYEEGEKFGRPHFHVLVFLKSGIISRRMCEYCWDFGFIKLKRVEKVKGVRYLTDYLFKDYGNKHIRNFSSSVRFGFEGFCIKSLGKRVFNYLTKGDFDLELFKVFFDEDFQYYLCDRIFVGDWNLYPRLWRDLYQKLVNQLLSIFSHSVCKYYLFRVSKYFLSKDKDLHVGYFEYIKDYNFATGTHLSARSGKFECEMINAAIFYKYFVPYFGYCNLNELIIDYYKDFCDVYRNDYRLFMNPVKNYFDGEYSIMNQKLSKRSDFLYRLNSTNFYGIEGYFKFTENKLNNLVFI